MSDESRIKVDGFEVGTKKEAGLRMVSLRSGAGDEAGTKREAELRMVSLRSGASTTGTDAKSAGFEVIFREGAELPKNTTCSGARTEEDNSIVAVCIAGEYALTGSNPAGSFAGTKREAELRMVSLRSGASTVWCDGETTGVEPRRRLEPYSYPTVTRDSSKADRYALLHDIYR